MPLTFISKVKKNNTLNITEVLLDIRLRTNVDAPQLRSDHSDLLNSDVGEQVGSAFIQFVP